MAAEYFIIKNLWKTLTKTVLTQKLLLLMQELQTSVFESKTVDNLSGARRICCEYKWVIWKSCAAEGQTLELILKMRTSVQTLPTWVVTIGLFFFTSFSFLNRHAGGHLCSRSVWSCQKSSSELWCGPNKPWSWSSCKCKHCPWAKSGNEPRAEVDQREEVNQNKPLLLQTASFEWSLCCLSSAAPFRQKGRVRQWKADWGFASKINVTDQQIQSTARHTLCMLPH